MAAADVRDPAAGRQLVIDAVERGDPAGGEVGEVAGAEEASPARQCQGPSPMRRRVARTVQGVPHEFNPDR